MNSHLSLIETGFQDIGYQPSTAPGHTFVEVHTTDKIALGLAQTIFCPAFRNSFCEECAESGEFLPFKVESIARLCMTTDVCSSGVPHEDVLGAGRRSAAQQSMNAVSFTVGVVADFFVSFASSLGENLGSVAKVVFSGNLRSFETLCEDSRHFLMHCDALDSSPTSLLLGEFPEPDRMMATCDRHKDKVILPILHTCSSIIYSSSIGSHTEVWSDSGDGERAYYRLGETGIFTEEVSASTLKDNFFKDNPETRLSYSPPWAYPVPIDFIRAMATEAEVTLNESAVNQAELERANTPVEQLNAVSDAAVLQINVNRLVRRLSRLSKKFLEAFHAAMPKFANKEPKSKPFDRNDYVTEELRSVLNDGNKLSNMADTELRTATNDLKRILEVAFSSQWWTREDLVELADIQVSSSSLLDTYAARDDFLGNFRSDVENLSRAKVVTSYFLALHKISTLAREIPDSITLTSTCDLEDPLCFTLTEKKVPFDRVAGYLFAYLSTILEFELAHGGTATESQMLINKHLMLLYRMATMEKFTSKAVEFLDSFLNTPGDRLSAISKVEKFNEVIPESLLGHSAQIKKLVEDEARETREADTLLTVVRLKQIEEKSQAWEQDARDSIEKYEKVASLANFILHHPSISRYSDTEQIFSIMTMMGNRNARQKDMESTLKTFSRALDGAKLAVNDRNEKFVDLNKSLFSELKELRERLQDHNLKDQVPDLFPETTDNYDVKLNFNRPVEHSMYHFDPYDVVSEFSKELIPVANRESIAKIMQTPSAFTRSKMSYLRNAFNFRKYGLALLNLQKGDTA